MHGISQVGVVGSAQQIWFSRNTLQSVQFRANFEARTVWLVSVHVLICQ
jgi:hypothetical protein